MSKVIISEDGKTATMHIYSASTNERDAKRWRAFLAAARIRRLGFAGLRQHKSIETPDYAHIGMEIWSTFSQADDPRIIEGNKDMQELLIEFADRMIAIQEKHGV